MLDDDSIVAKYNESWKKFASSVLQRSQDRAAELQIEIDTVHIINPIPSDAIIKASEALDADLIVVATHGYSGAKRLLLGSQANEIITLGRKSVLVVR